jgi:hypothetical protein
LSEALQEDAEIQSENMEVHGKAQLLLFPDGRISGSFTASIPPAPAAAVAAHDATTFPIALPDSISTMWPGSPADGQQCEQPEQQTFCLHLQGKQALAQHSCYRDTEWGLLRLTLTRVNQQQAQKQTQHSREQQEQQQQSLGWGGMSARGGRVVYLQLQQQLLQMDPQQQQQQEEEEFNQRHLLQLEGQQSLRKRQQQQQSKEDSDHLGDNRSHCRGGSRSYEEAVVVSMKDAGGKAEPECQQELGPEAAAAGGGGQGATTVSEEVSGGCTEVTSGGEDSEAVQAAAGAQVGPEGSETVGDEGLSIGGLSEGGEDVWQEAEEAVAWVQRTGGDRIRLEPADMEDEDTEVVIANESLGLEQTGFVHVTFWGEQLLAGAAAEQVVPGVEREAVRKEGAWVNLGRMVVKGLPSGWLG